MSESTPHIQPTMPPPRTARDQRLILLSVWASVGFAVLSSVWGILIGSSMIVFDGLYSFVSVGLSLLAVLTLRFTSRGADRRFPWGREVAEPLVVLLKAATLGGLCIYAAIGGVIDLVHGGREVSALSGVIYAAISTLGGAAVGLILHRAARPDAAGRPASDLVRAEAAEWIGDTLLSAGVLVGFAVALGLVAAGRSDLASYVDPGMVVLMSVIFLWVPARLILASMREILGMAPSPDLLEPVQEAVSAIGSEYRFSESFLRVAKVGGRMDIEVDFVVGPDSPVRTVPDCDRVREDLHGRFAVLGYERWVTVSFTDDRKWAL